MKRTIFIFVFLLGAICTVLAQNWEQLSSQQKMMKAIAFKEENQKFLKDILCLSDEQAADVESVNYFFLSTLDRIERYGKSDYDKQKYAKGLTQTRTTQLDAIMGVGKRREYMAFLQKQLNISVLM